MESSESPIFSVDANYCYTSFNKSHAATMKALYSADIEIGKKIIDYQTVLEDRVEAKKNIDKALRGERVVAEAYSGEDRLTRSYFIVSHNPIWDFEGQVVGVAVSAHDITMEKIAQAKIESMARFPIENPTPVLRVSKDGLIIFSNKIGTKFLNSMGFSIQDPIPEFLKHEISSCWEAMTSRTMEIQALNKIFSFFLVPIQEFGYINLYGTDITDLKNAQQSLSKLNAELEARVEERTRSLKDAQERMMRQEKLASIGKLAGSIGHELRNPLCVISNSIFYMGSKLTSGDEKIKRHMAIIREESERANKIISQLLDFARTKPEDITEVDISALINEIINENSTPHNINVSLSQGITLPRIHADPNKIRQVFQNIITNAFQAMPDGGTLDIKIVLNENEIEIAFKDTGVGISIENLSKIFEPLFSTKVKGIGLGLPIAKEIVESVGGKIVVESEVGVGSTFNVKLPLKSNNCFIDS
jgi:signal transduction histidine kinase